MEMVPVRLPDALARALDRVATREGPDRSAALRRLLSAGLERYVADLCGHGDLSLREAAAWMGVGVREAMDRLVDLGVASNITLEEAQAALELARKLQDG